MKKARKVVATEAETTKTRGSYGRLLGEAKAIQRVVFQRYGFDIASHGPEDLDRLLVLLQRLRRTGVPADKLKALI